MRILPKGNSVMTNVFRSLLNTGTQLNRAAPEAIVVTAAIGHAACWEIG